MIQCGCAILGYQQRLAIHNLPIGPWLVLLRKITCVLVYAGHNTMAAAVPVADRVNTFPHAMPSRSRPTYEGRSSRGLAVFYQR